MFNLALADDESPLTLDMGIITMKLDTFGQAAPGHDFHVLQALLDQQEGLNVRPSANTTKRLKRARAALQKVLTAASGG